MNGDIELEIGAGPGAGRYAVRVLRAAAGGEPAGVLDLDVDEVLSKRDLLEATVLASAVTHRSVPLAEQPVRQVGRQLFEALFTGPVSGMYRASLGVARERGQRLRVVLRLTAPELAALPWEMLFDPETETYLCRQEPLVRHVEAPYTVDPLEVRPPLRVLGVVAAPRDLAALDVEAEQALLAEALAGPVAAGLVELAWAPQATWTAIHARLLAEPWHVLHFIGHGGYDTRTDQGMLALAGADGRADLIDADRLADLLDEAEPTPRLVVLNSCSSARSGVNDLFSGTAAALARRGISAVAAMQFAISDAAAIAFARGFYTALAHGRGVDEAARSGRISILGASGSLEWVTPVLYLRGQASQLFTLTAPPVPPAPPAPPAPPVPPVSSADRAPVTPGRLEHRIAPSMPGKKVFAVSWHPDGRRIACAGSGPRVRVYALFGQDDRRELLVVKTGMPGNQVYSVAFSPDGARLAAGSANYDAVVWDVPTGQRLFRVKHTSWVRAVVFSPDGTRLATGSLDKAVKISNAANGQQVLAIYHPKAVHSLAFSPDGTRLATGSGDTTARIWDAATGRQLLQVQHQGLVHSVAFSPDGTRLATGSGDTTARIWDAATGRQLLQLQHQGPVQSLAFDPGGTRLATGSDDTTARIWDAATGRQLLQVRHDGPVHSVAFSPDGTRLATGGFDGTARVWLIAGL